MVLFWTKAPGTFSFFGLFAAWLNQAQPPNTTSPAGLQNATWAASVHVLGPICDIQPAPSWPSWTVRLQFGDVFCCDFLGECWLSDIYIYIYINDFVLRWFAFFFVTHLFGMCLCKCFSLDTFSLYTVNDAYTWNDVTNDHLRVCMKMGYPWFQ